MNSVDWTPVAQALGLLIATGITAVAAWGVAVFQQKTGIALTDQQKATVAAAANTAAGIIQTKIDQGALAIKDIHTLNDAVVVAAHDAIDRVPNSAAALGTTPEAMAALIVGKVDTSAKPKPVTVVAN